MKTPENADVIAYPTLAAKWIFVIFVAVQGMKIRAYP